VLHLKTHAAAVVAVAVWLSAVSLGMGMLWRYSGTPGQPAIPPAEWPDSAPVQPGETGSTLVMFAHPHCPCSRASIGELAIVMARSQRKLAAHVFFYVPRTEAGSWARTDLWNSAKAIPGVQVVEDPSGTFSKRFGASTSGQTLLYDSKGQLVFNGGITSSRGHSGDNNGRRAILALLQGEHPAQQIAPVFGCSLRGE
jgi:hypothetical protein